VRNFLKRTIIYPVALHSFNGNGDPSRNKDSLQIASLFRINGLHPSILAAANTCSERTSKDITMTNLFDSFDLGGTLLSNRIVMSAMTRTRATEDGVPTDIMRDYYVQRASAGLIITECTEVSDQGHGTIRAPGIHRADQIAAWRRTTDAVHAAGGRIYCQLWHCGRVSHPDIRNGELPVGPSPIAATGDFYLPSGRVAFPVPRELRTDEIAAIVADFAQATRNAREAGFDGVELHGANGYLQDQFLQDGSNKRTDRYGGSIENRARLMIETVEAMIGAWSAARIGVRLSPSSWLSGIDDSNKLVTFSYIVRALGKLNIGYLCLREPSAEDAARGVQIERVVETFRPMAAVPVMANTGYDKEMGNALLENGCADLVAFGVPFIANPDLVERFRRNLPLSMPDDPSTFYGAGAKGYTDYPVAAVSKAST
jgi:N-ethylmaleimide reductase